MSLIPSRRSKKQRLARAAGKTAKKAAKAKAVQKAPKTAAAVWAGKRSGKVLRIVAATAVGAFVLKKVLGRKGDEPTWTPPPTAADTPSANGTAESYRATPTPASSQQTEGGGASGPDPSGPTSTAQNKAEAKGAEESATPPHGDPLADDAESRDS